MRICLQAVSIILNYKKMCQQIFIFFWISLVPFVDCFDLIEFHLKIQLLPIKKNDFFQASILLGFLLLIAELGFLALHFWFSH